jgi:hypothetical protein
MESPFDQVQPALVEVELEGVERFDALRVRLRGLVWKPDGTDSCMV